MKQEQSVSRFVYATKVAARLTAEHGELFAQKLAMAGLRKARRARSRRQFNFWTEVASQLGAQSSVTAAKPA